MGGTVNRGYVFRFEAEGYAPFVTRAYRPDEGEVTLEIKLHKAEETLVGIYTPNGEPALNAQIGLLAPGSELSLAAGGFSTQASFGPTWLRRADNRGQFILPTDDTVQRLAIAHPAGYVECDVAEMSKARSVQLKPWARVEGVWLEGGQPAGQREVSLEFNFKNRPLLLRLEYSAYRTTTDENGRFVFPQVPSGLLDVVAWTKSTASQTRSFGAHVQTFQLEPGEIKQLTVTLPTVARHP